MISLFLLSFVLFLRALVYVYVLDRSSTITDYVGFLKRPKRPAPLLLDVRSASLFDRRLPQKSSSNRLPQ